MNASDQYAEFWGEKPLLWRIKHRVWWRGLTIWSAVTGGVSPGERWLLRLLQKAQTKDEA